MTIEPFTYDLAGNATNDSRNQYLYDAEGRLCAVQDGVLPGTYYQYVYGAGGTRVAKGTLSLSSWPTACPALSAITMTASYVLGLGGEQVSEVSISGSTSTWAHTNIFAGGALLATYDPAANEAIFALNDWLGTKRSEYGTTGCTSNYFSLPYGNGLTPSGTCPDATEHHFTGKERDSESGNDYFGARYYASSMGRWMSPDWSKTPEGVPYADLSNPQSLNLYAYVKNNPLSHADVDGHGELWDKFKAIFYAKVSIGPGVGGELKATQAVKGTAEAKAGVETKATVKGETTVLKAEASLGVKAGSAEFKKTASVEMQVEKDGKLDIQKPEAKLGEPSAGAGPVEAKKDEIGVSVHEGAFGGEVGVDVDKAREFGGAVKEHVNAAIDNTVKKVLPNQN